jgi:hypothetical protein
MAIYPRGPTVFVQGKDVRIGQPGRQGVQTEGNMR